MEKKRVTRGGVTVGPAETAKRGRKSSARGRSPSPVRKASPPAKSKKSPGRKPSPARKASPGWKPSPGRKASPGRKPSPARKASPARKPSPARKASPARKPSPARKASPVRKTTKSAAVKTSAPEVKEELRRSTRIKISEHREKSPVSKKTSRDKLLTIILDDDEELLSKKSSPAKSTTPNTSQRSVITTTERSRGTGSRSISVVNDSQEFSDQEEIEFQSFRKDDNGLLGEKSYARRYSAKQQQDLREFGGTWGVAAVLLLVPAFLFLTNHFCSGTHRDCFLELPTSFDEFKSLSTYISRETAILYVTFTWWIAIISMIPIGKAVKIVDDIRGPQSFVFTGLSCAVFTGLTIFVAEYCYKFPLVSTISKAYNKLLVTSIIYALFTAVVSYHRSLYIPQNNWNPYGKTGRILSDYFVGREINPQTFNVLNLKLVHYHISVVLALVFNCIILYFNLHFTAFPKEQELSLLEKVLFTVKNVDFSPTPVVAASLTILYLLDLLAYEHHLTFSFDLQSEGFGALLLLRYAVFPFTLTFLPKYIAAHKLADVPHWMLALVAVIAITGLVIKRSSNRLKHQYRLNPLGEKFIDLETLPTFQGRRLLVAKWWGRVRQPNYVGDILQNIALLPLLYWRFAWPPLLAVLFSVAVLVQRARRVNDRNAKKYNSAWQRYCSIVRYILVPKVF